MPLLGTRFAASITGFGGLSKLGYLLRNSLRFRSSASATLTRTPSVAGNRRTWTISFWYKPSTIFSNSPNLFQAGYNSIPWTALTSLSTGAFDIAYTAGSTPGSATSALYRDPAAWYHVVWATDTTQATDSNRMKFYINGVLQTLASTSYPSQNFDTPVNNTVAHSLGGWSSQYYDGYMAEVNFVDGQALTPSSFGKTDPVTGQWIPIKYSGTYGTNGFYLNFTDASAATAAAIGKDFSGNGNNWTPNNISVTAGVTYDSMTDVPTLTNATTANYCTLNPLAATYATPTISNGNLDVVSNGNYAQALGTIAVPPSGKWYWEATATIGVGDNERRFVGLWSTNNFDFGNSTPQESTQGALHYYALDGDIAINDPFPFADYGATWTTGDVIGVAVNMDTNQVTFYKNNASQGTVSLPSNMQGVSLYPSVIGLYSNSGLSLNFGQRPFTYTPPSGFKSLNTFNLP
jgi:hypothetical protein